MNVWGLFCTIKTVTLDDTVVQVKSSVDLVVDVSTLFATIYCDITVYVLSCYLAGFLKG